MQTESSIPNMPNDDQIATGCFCAQCAEKKTPEELSILYFRRAETEYVPDPKWNRVQRYCTVCLPRMKEGVQKREGEGSIEFRTEPFIPHPVKEKE